jgi:hypothetical protein
MSHGGARPGAGRKKGAITKWSQKAAEEAERTGEMPLAYLLRVMRDENQKLEVRVDCAKAAAPYVHHKLVALAGAIDVNATITEVRHMIIDSPVS